MVNQVLEIIDKSDTAKLWEGFFAKYSKKSDNDFFDNFLYEKARIYASQMSFDKLKDALIRLFNEHKFLPKPDDILKTLKLVNTYKPSRSLDIWRQVEELIKTFKSTRKDLCLQAKQEGWLGDDNPKSFDGLLGFMRTSFAIQIKAIEGLEMPLPIHQKHLKFVTFFRSKWLRDQAIKNGYVKDIISNNHIELLRSGQI